MSGTTTNLVEAYTKDVQNAQENFVERHHALNAAKTCISLLKSQDATLTRGQKEHLKNVEASLPDLEAALREAEEELESANITLSYKRFAPSTASQAATTTAPIFTTQRSEFGMYKFADPRRQATYEYHEGGYMKMLKLKNAYDKQELMRKMRIDMKREYLTRKKQVTRLQKDAAIDFRNAESSLQEHYATEAADHHPYIRAVDINAPLVSQIQLPHGKSLDLKTFNEHNEFARVRQIHEDLRRDQEEQEQEQSRWWDANAEALAKWEQRQYEQRRPYAPRAEQKQPKQQQEEEQPGRYGDGGYCGCDDLECSDCYSYGGDNDGALSPDSEYDGLFPDYPREYNYERECREAEEAAAEAAAEQQRWEENTRNSDGETWDEEAIANEAEHRREVALMKLNDDMSYQCDDYHDVVQVTEPKERITVAAAGGTISAKTKAKSKTNAAAAAKARIAKKQQNKEKNFTPIQITINTNRSNVDEVVSALLYTSKVEINLPKKNQQQAGNKSEAAAREARKREAAKWKRINAEQKQCNARGTRIANIPEPRAWYHEPNDYDDDDFE